MYHTPHPSSPPWLITVMVIRKWLLFFAVAQRPNAGHGLLILEVFLDHTQLRTTVGRTPMDEWSACRRDLYLTAHNTHNRQISTPSVGFEPTISTGELPQTYALDRAVIHILMRSGYEYSIKHIPLSPIKTSFICFNMEIRTTPGLMHVYIVMSLAFLFGWELRQLFHTEEVFSGPLLLSLNVNVG
jgi:hypothetical protein